MKIDKHIYIYLRDYYGKYNRKIKIISNGNIYYFNELSLIHREDGPAIEYSNGNKYWYLNGKLHRVNGPAIEYANGDKVWYLNDKLHREDGPAIEFPDGEKHWYLNGKLHRENGPAIEHANGNKQWYLHGTDCEVECYYYKKLKILNKKLRRKNKYETK